MNSKAKGRRTVKKVKDYMATMYPNGYCLDIPQASMYSTPQPMDLILFRPGFKPILIEVRSNQWGVNKPQTVQLSKIPGLVDKEIWMVVDGSKIPIIRKWNGKEWVRTST